MGRVSIARDYILGKSPSKTWRMKVARMRPNQVLAIYYKFLRKDAEKGDFDPQISLFETNPKEMEAVRLGK